MVNLIDRLKDTLTMEATIFLAKFPEAQRLADKTAREASMKKLSDEEAIELLRKRIRKWGHGDITVSQARQLFVS